MKASNYRQLPAALHLHGRRCLQDRGKPAGPHRGRAGPAGSVWSCLVML